MMGQGQSVQGAVRLQAVTCVRGERTLFSGLSVALAPGDAAMVSGPNGIGKSSLLRLIAGLLVPASGTLEVTGRMALTSEATTLDPRLPLAEALTFWAGIDGANDNAVTEALRDMAIEHLGEVPVRILSTGQKKRAVLASVIAGGAEIWLLDEPANGLDLKSIGLLENVIARHRAGGGIALVATHQPLTLPGAQSVVLA
jgi:heme exporter protein A